MVLATAQQSQTLKALLGLRALIVDGELKASERVSEQMVVDRLGVSRTPARAALARLAEEGFLKPLNAGGYVVAEFSEKDVLDAIDIRGTLEGMAARFAAERGVRGDVLSRMRICVDALDRVVDAPSSLPDSGEYVRLNDEFHALLVEAANSPMIRRSLDRVLSLPFASPNAFVQARSNLPAVRNVFVLAQEQHRAILDAIENREGMRAQMLAIEHSRSAWKNFKLALDEARTPGDLPGANLIRFRR